MKKGKKVAVTVHLPAILATKLRKNAAVMNVTFSKLCNMMLSTDKDNLLIERQALMKRIYELRKKISMSERHDEDVNNKDS